MKPATIIFLILLIGGIILINTQSSLVTTNIGEFSYSGSVTAGGVSGGFGTTQAGSITPSSSVTMTDNSNADQISITQSGWSDTKSTSATVWVRLEEDLTQYKKVIIRRSANMGAGGTTTSTNSVWSDLSTSQGVITADDRCFECDAGLTLGDITIINANGILTITSTEGTLTADASQPVKLINQWSVSGQNTNFNYVINNVEYYEFACVDDETQTVTCADGTIITTKQCVNNDWQTTSESCPIGQDPEPEDDETNWLIIGGIGLAIITLITIILIKRR